MGFYATTGGSVKALDVADVFGADPGLTADVQPRTFYRVVPFVRRAVRLRANAIAGVPVTLQRGERDISARPEFAALMSSLQVLIWKTEFALCLSTYGAYWRRTTNAAGLNPTPEWLLPQACWPYISAERGLEYIRYVRPFGVERAGQVDLLPPDEVVRFWLPSLDRANWPGPPPGLTAEAAASALANRDAFVSQYFARGAVKGVLLSVPTNTNRDERDKLLTWWRSLFAGIASAWRSIVISADVKPIIIGEGMEAANAGGLTNQYRQDVAAAFEVPESMLLSNAANFATAREERISFYEETVFPELGLILGAINNQWLREQYDAELVAHPEQTEARQDAQVQQAQAVTELVGSPVLTVDEGRAWLGLEPMEQQQPAPAADTEDQDEAAMQQQEDEEAQQEDAADVKAFAGSATRATERIQLVEAHRALRAETRERHKGERTLARERHLDERRAASDAGTRLRLVHRHKAELAMLSSRQAAERAMLWSVQSAERERLRDRHAAARVIPTNGHTAEQVLA